MRNKKYFAVSLLLAAALGSSSIAFAKQPKSSGPTSYEITVTNITRGQSFTPILVATHEAGPQIFTLGAPASDELAALAEGGDIMPLSNSLSQDPRVGSIASSAGLLMPGESVSIMISANSGTGLVSLAAMLIPTNDAFFALKNVELLGKGMNVTMVATAYDAGSEPNDEDCASIPGPVCGGVGGSPGVGGEGFVHVHAGIHGIGSLIASDRDWRNSVALVHIKAVD